MRMRVSFVVAAIVAGLAGCATTDESKPSAAATPSTGAAAASPATGTPGTGQVGTGTATATGTPRPDLKRSVYYEFDKYDVKPEYRELIESHARWLRANPQARLTIEGNADERGSREYNVALGQRRAESVTKMLVLLGAKPEQIEAVSFGKEKPRAAGHDESAWAENRRSDFAQR